MSQASELSLEAILRYCAAAAPQPWYPAVHAKEKGMPRDDLDPYLDPLRMAGLIRLTDWVKDIGQGYTLTDEGREALNNPRALARLRQGQLPDKPAPPKPRPDDEPTTYERGEMIRESVLTPTPIPITRLLLALNIGVFIYGWFLANQEGIGNDYLSWRGGGQASPIYLSIGAVSPASLLDGQWWRLLTSCFVHIGLMHLGFNMYVLYVIGQNVERMWGPARYTILYLLSGWGASCLAMALQPKVTFLAGASGALCGVLASEALWVFLNRRYLPAAQVSAYGRTIIINLILITFISLMPGISGYAHLGGALVGVAVTLLLQVQRFGRPVKKTLAGAGLVLVPVLSTGWLLYAMQTNPTWQRMTFEKFHLKQISQTLRDGGGVYDKQIALLARREPSSRDSAQVRQALHDVAASRQRLTDLADTLKRLPAYIDPQVEEARQVGLEYVQTLEHLLERGEQCLANGGAWSAEDQAQVEKVKTVQKKWRGLLE
ncbi:MAG: rhomboid family intramembrane serine protease [Gemmataceae bacterium]